LEFSNKNAFAGPHGEVRVQRSVVVYNSPTIQNHEAQRLQWHALAAGAAGKAKWNWWSDGLTDFQGSVMGLKIDANFRNYDSIICQQIPRPIETAHYYIR